MRAGLIDIATNRCVNVVELSNSLTDLWFPPKGQRILFSEKICIGDEVVGDKIFRIERDHHEPDIDIRFDIEIGMPKRLEPMLSPLELTLKEIQARLDKLEVKLGKE